MIVGIFIILLFYFLGECVSYLFGGLVPGSVCGMVLLFLSLMFKLVKPAQVQSVASVLTRNMTLFFVPAGVGLMASFDLISKYWAAILVVSTVTTILIIAVVAWLQDKMEHRSPKHKIETEN